MSDNVVLFPGFTSLPIAPERVLEQAAKQKFDRVLIIGYTEDGEEYIAASDPDGGLFLWDVERAKLRLLRSGDE